MHVEILRDFCGSSKSDKKNTFQATFCYEKNRFNHVTDFHQTLYHNCTTWMLTSHLILRSSVDNFNHLQHKVQKQTAPLDNKHFLYIPNNIPRNPNGWWLKSIIVRRNNRVTKPACVARETGWLLSLYKYIYIYITMNALTSWLIFVQNWGFPKPTCNSYW